MADYRTIPDAEVDPDAPLTSSLGYAWRDNPIAIAEGATGAPRITRAALSPPVISGTSILQQTVSSTAGGGSGASSGAVSCFVPGSIRFNITELNIVGGSQSGEVWIQRSRRGGPYINLTQVTSNGNYDTNIIVGDRLRIIATSGFAYGASFTVNVTVGNDSVGVVVI